MGNGSPHIWQLFHEINNNNWKISFEGHCLPSVVVLRHHPNTTCSFASSMWKWQKDENPPTDYKNLSFSNLTSEPPKIIIIIEDSPVKDITFQQLFILGTTHSITSRFVSSTLKVDIPGCEPESVTCLWIMRNSHFPIWPCLPRDYNGA